MKLALIPAGKFTMGSPRSEQGRGENEGPQHEVEITRPFYMGAYSVTRTEFAMFVEAARYTTEAEQDGKGGWGYDRAKRKFVLTRRYTWRNTGFGQTDRHPVVNVTWRDAVKFCEWLSKKEGKVYELPTEAEWEYACRAGATTRFWCGDSDDSLKGVANVRDQSCKVVLAAGALPEPFEPWHDGFPFPSPVGIFRANPWGLYDMHGNVAQWCADRYGPYSEGQKNDLKALRGAEHRVLRGGAWSDPARDCRSARRADVDPGERGASWGFRVVLHPDAQTP
jgi:formylglycine-generating enzyme required for sulfatase activity